MQYAFNVRLNGKLINTVFYTLSGTIAEQCESVRLSLINHDGYDPNIRIVWPKGQRVTETSYDLEGDYGQGFEVLCSASTWKEARANKKDYLDNSPCPMRIVRRLTRKG